MGLLIALHAKNLHSKYKLKIKCYLPAKVPSIRRKYIELVLINPRIEVCNASLLLDASRFISEISNWMFSRQVSMVAGGFFWLLGLRN